MWYWTKVLFFILIGAVSVWVLYEVATFPHIWNLRTENPTTTSLIEYRISEDKAAGEEPKVVLGHGRERVAHEGGNARTVTAVREQVLPDEVDDR